MNSCKGQITAVLGPTNTGKTHFAIERMTAHKSGIIGLPLRLLAREVYEKVARLMGTSSVALVTGEERIVPARTRYWICTVEAMPLGLGHDFLAVDEIQMCADLERGHVFTDRLLGARGRLETMFLGSDTMRGIISALVPEARFVQRKRLSTLSYAGPKKLSRMPSRSAIVGFSVDGIYSLAELVRRQKGGAAIVMGALSPRTRNAQVSLYQSGDVDYLVATDAIGMGLNLDIRHVAFSATAKFDGRKLRKLAPNELAQIAGRAGRFESPGSFGVTGSADPLDQETVDAIESHRFKPVERLQWRNSKLSFDSLEALAKSLDAPSPQERLVKARESEDLAALGAFAGMPAIADKIGGPDDVSLLWEVCQIPDYRKDFANEHVALLGQIFEFLVDRGSIPSEWVGEQVRRLDRDSGTIDAISRRLAYIRTWTFVSHKRGWMEEERRWREETRAVEDRLSDALHACLIRQFVDRRTSVLQKKLRQKESLEAEVNQEGGVAVEGQFVGKLAGFRFRQDGSGGGGEAKVLRSASLRALASEYRARAQRLSRAPDQEIALGDHGSLLWGECPVGKLLAGKTPMDPEVAVFVDDEAGSEVAEKVRARLLAFIRGRIRKEFGGLLEMREDPEVKGLAKGVGFRVGEALGVLRKELVVEDVRALDQAARGQLRKHGVRFGYQHVYCPDLLRPAPTRLRIMLLSVFEGLAEFPAPPPPGLVTIRLEPGVDLGRLDWAGFYPAGSFAVRVDMLERLWRLLREAGQGGEFEASSEMLSITGQTHDGFADLMRGLGYFAERRWRPRAVVDAPGSPEAAAGESASLRDSAQGGGERQPPSGENRGFAPADGSGASPGGPEAVVDSAQGGGESPPLSGESRDPEPADGSENAPSAPKALGELEHVGGARSLSSGESPESEPADGSDTAPAAPEASGNSAHAGGESATPPAETHEADFIGAREAPSGEQGQMATDPAGGSQAGPSPENQEAARERNPEAPSSGLKPPREDLALGHADRAAASPASGEAAPGDSEKAPEAETGMAEAEAYYVFSRKPRAAGGPRRKERKREGKTWRSGPAAMPSPQKRRREKAPPSGPFAELASLRREMRPRDERKGQKPQDKLRKDRPGGKPRHQSARPEKEAEPSGPFAELARLKREMQAAHGQKGRKPPGKPRGDRPAGKQGPQRSRPEKAEEPSGPFAALMKLKKEMQAPHG